MPEAPSDALLLRWAVDRGGSGPCVLRSVLAGWSGDGSIVMGSGARGEARVGPRPARPSQTRRDQCVARVSTQAHLTVEE